MLLFLASGGRSSSILVEVFKSDGQNAGLEDEEVIERLFKEFSD